MPLHSSSTSITTMAAAEKCFVQRLAARQTTYTFRQARVLHRSSRNDVEATTASTEKLLPFDTAPVATPPQTPVRPLKKLSTTALLRSIMLSEVFARPWIANIGMKVLTRLTTSKQPFLDPDRNWFLRSILRATIYDHFCGGWQRNQIQRSLSKVKEAGYSGVILQYAREVVEGDLQDATAAAQFAAQQISEWHEFNSQTLSMLSPGDYMAIKFTGAGGSVAEALRKGTDRPAQFDTALNDLCASAKAKNVRLLVDAEQQVFQATIDRWAVDLMRKYNRDGDAYILNTYQAYLKSTPTTLRGHLRLAGQEGWHMGIKLVRGAYLGIETRSLIHDTKADTDACYNGVVSDVLSESALDGKDTPFPQVRLLAAGHNAESIRRATNLRKDMLKQGINSGPLDFGQLYGMADHVSGELLAQSEAARHTPGLSPAEQQLQNDAAPRVFKCLHWGSVRECLGFLNRRAVENQGSADRLLDGLEASKKELWARILRRA